MKVIVEDVKRVEPIDWKKVQLVQSTQSGDIVLIDEDQSEAKFGCFCGIKLGSGYSSKEFVKEIFKPFNGSITLQND